MEEFIKIMKKLFEMNVVQSILVIILNFIIYKIISHFITKGEASKRVSRKLNNRSKTYIRLVKSILRYVIIILTVLIIFQINGINVSSMIAGVGIASVILGLAVQDALKDIIRGFTILSDDYFSVGDVIIYNDIVGKVEVLGLKTTKIKDIATGNLVAIANRNIEQVQIVSENVFVEVPLPYELQVDKAEKIVAKIVEKIKTDKDTENAEYIGVKELADSSIKYYLKLMCKPEKRLMVKRIANECILRVLETENVAVPYNQIDVHQKIEKEK